MDLPGRTIDGLCYTSLIETLVGMTIKLEIIRQSLDLTDVTSTELISQIRNDTVKAAALAQIDPEEWERVNNQMISELTIKPN
jgi:hypothetical protein